MREVQPTCERCCETVGDRIDAVETTGSPRRRLSVMPGAPSGSTPITRALGLSALIAAAAPADQPATADPDDHRVDVGHLLDDFQA